MGARWRWQVAAAVWAALGFGVAAGAVARARFDVSPAVLAATVLFPACAVAAAWAIGAGRPRLAGGLLMLSAATPTYFAWALNVPALLVGLALVLGAGAIERSAGASVSG